MKDYTKLSIALLKAAAKRITRDETARICHIAPRAYCVAKPALRCAIFVVPPCDREPQVADDAYTSVSNASADNVKAGDWCSVAYVVTARGGEPYVLRRLEAGAR